MEKVSLTTTIKDKRFTTWLENNWQKDNMFPPPLDAQEAITFLEYYLLGENWYIVNPLTNAQANVESVHQILYKYSKKYKKEYKKWKEKCKEN